MADFEIRMMNETEVGVAALTPRAANASHIKPEHMLVFKSLNDGSLQQYISELERQGLTFSGKELLEALT